MIDRDSYSPGDRGYDDFMSDDEETFDLEAAEDGDLEFTGSTIIELPDLPKPN